MARDRKRAKQRRDRRVREGAPAGPRKPPRPDLELPEPSQPQRSELPGSLDHSSGEADEFDAALVRGAGGLAADGADVEQAELESEQDLDAGEPGSGDALQEAPPGGAGGGGGRRHGGDEQPSGAPLRGGNRAIGFLRASWAELQRVQWPDRRQVTQATAVVLGFVAVAGAYLGLADYVAKEIVEAILT